MKNKRITVALVAIVVALFASCNVYEHQELEIRRCPQVQDTVIIPEWDDMEP